MPNFRSAKTFARKSGTGINLNGYNKSIYRKLKKAYFKGKKGTMQSCLSAKLLLRLLKT